MRLPILDGYRAASILFVLWGHLLPLGPKAWKLNESVATLGMTMFFSLSGFLITSQLLKDQHVGRFLLRRIARIWPLVGAYTLIVYVLVDYSPEKLLLTNLFVVNYVSQYLDSWNGHLWSLCVEVQFYAGIAFVVLIGGRHSLWLAWPICAGITLSRIVVGAEIDILTHLRVDEILIGACVATLPLLASRHTHSPWLLMAALGATLFSSWPDSGFLQYARPYLTGLLLVAAICQDPKHWAAKVLASKPAKYVADISYSLYVVHPAFTLGWFNSTSSFDKYLIKRPIGIALTFVLAHLSTYYWERPWTKFAREFAVKLRESEAVVKD
jgi:peptidoglycan/LPS O-acetylase OafA/YrhL